MDICERWISGVRNSYIRAQEEFVCVNNIKPGTKVRIIRKAESYSYGWETYWHPKLDTLLGNIVICCDVIDHGTKGILIRSEDAPVSFYVPFFILEKVKEEGQDLTFKKNDRVLVRNSTNEEWQSAVFFKYDPTSTLPYVVYKDKFKYRTYWKYCIPYKGNEHLCCVQTLTESFRFN